jgi:1,6-anhydro-N-acetylmuramate kinase
MSGTNLDGIDGVLLSFTNKGIEILRHAEIEYPDSLQRDLLALFTPSDNEIERMQIAGYKRNDLATIPSPAPSTAPSESLESIQFN